MREHLKILICLLLSALCAEAFAQSTSEEVLGRPADVSSAQFQSIDQYESLAQQWKKIVERNQSDASAWLNWFEAERLSSFEGKKKIISAPEKHELSKILTAMKGSVPGSAEYKYAQFLFDPFNENSFGNLLAAAASASEKTEIKLAMAGYGKITNNASVLKEYCKAIQSADIFNHTEMEYNYNVLMSCPQNTVLFTHGDDDTYPLLILQELQNVRKDVSVVNIEWLNNGKYREQILKETGLSIAASGQIGNYDWIAAVIQSSRKHPVALPLTFPVAFLTQQSRDLYCTGLVFQTMPDPEMKMLEENWMSFRLTHFDSSSAIQKNYKVPLYMLDQHYATLGNENKRKSLKPFKEHFPNFFPAER